MAKKTPVIEKTEMVSEPVMDSSKDAIVVNCERLNLRKTASKSADIIKVLNNGEKVKVVKENKDWTKIEIGEVTGYVMNNYINVI